VRNLGSNLGKRVALTMDGRDVELDRSILEGIVDPINHMLRNAVDHGIETAQDRVARGKPASGRISICSTAHGDAVTVEILDDGRGMDPQRIRQAAVERQLLSRDEADALEDAEVLMLVTTPGFSTAEQLTEVSGRGVGMDVVRTRIESLGGRLKIHSTPGKGTRIVLRLPLTVAVIQGFLVQAAGQLYAVPVSSVARTVEVETDGLEIEDGQMWLDTEEGRIQLHSLALLMNGNGLENEKCHKSPAPALLFHCEDRTLGILVDAVLGKRDMVVKPLHSPLENLREYSGATILEEGRIALILDLQNLIACG
jgi:two-component system chemotaxis sensor kinase CheA